MGKVISGIFGGGGSTTVVNENTASNATDFTANVTVDNQVDVPLTLVNDYADLAQAVENLNTAQTNVLQALGTNQTNVLQTIGNQQAAALDSLANAQIASAEAQGAQTASVLETVNDLAGKVSEGVTNLKQDYFDRLEETEKTKVLLAMVTAGAALYGALNT